jgi:hypothetical protein
MKPNILYLLNSLWFLPLMFMSDNLIIVSIATIFIALVDFYFLRRINKWKPSGIIASLVVIRKFNYTILIISLVPITNLLRTSDDSISINLLILVVVFLLKDIIFQFTSDKIQYLIVLIEKQIIVNNIWIQKRSVIDLKSVYLNGFTNRFKFKGSFIPFSYELNQFEHKNLEKFILEILKINSNIEISENLHKKLRLSQAE